MKKLIVIICIALISCNTAKQLEKAVAKVERYKKALGVKPCDCLDKVITTWPPSNEYYPRDFNIWGGPNYKIPMPYSSYDSIPFNIDRGIYRSTPDSLFFNNGMKLDTIISKPIRTIYE